MKANSGHLDRRRWVRRLQAVTPVVVWCGAIVFAITLHRKAALHGDVVGYAVHQTITLAHPEPAVVRAMHVRLYDTVQAGQVLVTLDDTAERIELAAVEDDIERLAARVAAERARLEADHAWSSADVDDLARRFAVNREAAHIDYLAQLATDARDRMLLQGALVEHEFVKELCRKDNSALIEFNDTRTEVQSLTETVAKNEAVVARKREAFEAADRRWSLFIKEKEVAARYEPILTPLRLAIDVRRHDLDDVVRRIDAHALRAPVAGQVTTLAVNAGSTVEAGVPLLVISPTSSNQVLAFLSEEQIRSARRGTRVAIRRVAFDDPSTRLAGTVQSLAESVSEAPLRFRRASSVPIWGRGLLIELDDEVVLMPGEAVHIAFLAN